MPEYLAPAVYVEETSFRSRSIAGVGTIDRPPSSPDEPWPGQRRHEPRDTAAAHVIRRFRALL